MVVVIPILVYFLLMAFIITLAKKSQKGRIVISDDGHQVKQSEDLTCETKDGHRHPKNNDFGPRYIVHNEPSEGYVTLNGIVRKIEDCKDL